MEVGSNDKHVSGQSIDEELSLLNCVSVAVIARYSLFSPSLSSRRILSALPLPAPMSRTE